MPMQFKADASQTAIDGVINDLKSAVTALEAIVNSSAYNELIFAWDNGLGVKYNEDGTAHACGIEHATTVYVGKTYPEVFNGKNEKAMPIHRGKVAQREMDKLIDILRELGF